jgi:hypothetical protein
MLESESLARRQDDPQPTHEVQRILSESGVSLQQVESLIVELPRRSEADELVNWFFANINYIRYPISEHLFRQSFAMLYGDPSVTSASILALPLIFIVLAMAVRVAPEQWMGGENEKRSNSLRMYWNCKLRQAWMRNRLTL